MSTYGKHDVRGRGVLETSFSRKQPLLVPESLQIVSLAMKTLSLGTCIRCQASF